MKKILIVEDEQAYLNLLHDQLVKSGYEVMNASDGEEGLKLALEKKPDLILLDLIMPRVGGLKMLKILRRFKWGERVPVFILTNVDESGEITEALNYDVSQYIVKSDFKLENLLDSVKLFCKGGDQDKKNTGR